MPYKIPPERKERYAALRRIGQSRAAAARGAGVSYNWATEFDRSGGDRNTSRSAKMRREDYKHREVPDPLPADELAPEAAMCLEDIEKFALRYFGIQLDPWQCEAAEVAVRALETPDDEFLLVNVGPGSGKSTFFTLILPSWVTCRERAIRGLIGSFTETQATWYTRRLKAAFERTIPVTASGRDKSTGMAFDADSTLCHDFGGFKPDSAGNLWRAGQFVVNQLDDMPTAEKEPTWSSFGMDSAFLGGRFDFMVWDDVFDPSKLRSADKREEQRQWWQEYAETRLEPGGVLILQGQRMHSDDIYAFAKTLRFPPVDDDPEERPKYQQIIYPAHFEERCQDDHGADAKPYPDGCLLSPRRLNWHKLRTVQVNSAERYRVLYQQEDSDPSTQLVNPLWVSGGEGADGVFYPGCWDKERRLGQVPDLVPPYYSIAVADPSPTKYWAIQWWLAHPPTEQRFLIDLISGPMDAPDFLDFDPQRRVYSGVMEEWQERSKALGIPIRWWIIENNAAQRWLLQYRHTVEWRLSRGTSIVPHSTGMNKLDEQYGVTMIRDHWKWGRYRLPGSPDSRPIVMRLVNEVTKWPEGGTDDQVMAQWMFEHNLARLVDHHHGEELPRQTRPSWLAGVG